MNRYGTLVITLLFAVTLSLLGCEIARRKPPAGSLTHIQTLGVISLLGDRLQEQHVGLTRQSKEPVYYDVGEWNVDSYIDAFIVDEVASRYQIVNLNYAPDELEKVYVKELLRSTDLDQISRELTDLYRDTGVDAFLILTHRLTLDPIGHANQMLDRYGLYDRRVLKRTLTAYASVKITLIDGATLEPFAAWRAFKHKQLAGPIADDFNRMSAAEKAKVKKAVFTCLQDAVSEILIQLGL